MKIQKIAVLLVILALIVALEVVMMNRCTREDSATRPVAAAEPSDVPGQSQSSPELPAAATAQPTAQGYPSLPGGVGGVPTQPPATEPPAAAQPATDPPAATPAPTEPPAPTQAPTEPPAGSVGSTISSDNFSSNTGTSLNLSVSWKATDLGGGMARIAITGTVNSYELNVSALPISISFGSHSASVTGNSIKVSSGGLSSNTLFSTTIDVPVDSADTMTVTWKYNGSYSDVSLPEITASGYVYT